MSSCASRFYSGGRSEEKARKIKELEQKLARAERGLNRKGSDAYRRRHAVFS